MLKNQEDIKKNNIELVLNTLFHYGPISRIELARITKLSTTSITRVTQNLIEKGYIEEKKYYLNKAGRNPNELHIIPSSAYTIGVEILQNCMMFSVLNLNREIVLNTKENIDVATQDIKDIANFILNISRNLLFKNDISYENSVVGIGIAIPGIVDNNKGIVNFSTQLGWKNENIVKVFSDILNKPVLVENDTKARMIAKENSSRIVKNNCVVGLFIGEGVSAVGISEGLVVRGANNAAGEVGHIITNYNGMECDCGSKGCLQTKLATKFLIKKAKENDSNIKDVKEILINYDADVLWAKDIINEFKTSFLLILDILQHCYNPSLIIVSGEIIDSFESFLKEFTEEFELINKTTSTSIKIIVSPNDKCEPAIGVALLSFNSLFK